MSENGINYGMPIRLLREGLDVVELSKATKWA